MTSRSIKAIKAWKNRDRQRAQKKEQTRTESNASASNRKKRRVESKDDMSGVNENANENKNNVTRRGKKKNVNDSETKNENDISIPNLVTDNTRQNDDKDAKESDGDATEDEDIENKYATESTSVVIPTENNSRGSETISVTDLCELTHSTFFEQSMFKTVKKSLDIIDPSLTTYRMHFEATYQPMMLHERHYFSEKQNKWLKMWNDSSMDSGVSYNSVHFHLGFKPNTDRGLVPVSLVNVDTWVVYWTIKAKLMDSKWVGKTVVNTSDLSGEVHKCDWVSESLFPGQCSLDYHTELRFREGWDDKKEVGIKESRTITYMDAFQRSRFALLFKVLPEGRKKRKEEEQRKKDKIQKVLEKSECKNFPIFRKNERSQSKIKATLNDIIKHEKFTRNCYRKKEIARVQRTTLTEVTRMEEERALLKLESNEKRRQKPKEKSIRITHSISDLEPSYSLPDHITTPVDGSSNIKNVFESEEWCVVKHPYYIFVNHELLVAQRDFGPPTKLISLSDYTLTPEDVQAYK